MSLINYIHGLFRLVLLISEMFTKILTHPLPRPRIIHSRPCCQRHMSLPLEVPEPSHAASRLIPRRAVVFGIHFLRQIPLQFNGEWKQQKNPGESVLSPPRLSPIQHEASLLRPCFGDAFKIQGGRTKGSNKLQTENGSSKELEGPHGRGSWQKTWSGQPH